MDLLHQGIFDPLFMAEAAKGRHRNPSYRLALSSIKETDDLYKDEDKMEKITVPDLIDMDAFNEMVETEQMEKLVSRSMSNQLCFSTQGINKAITHPDTRIETQLITVQAQLDDNSGSITDLKWENKVLKGLVQHQHKQIQSLNDKVTQLTMRNMENNIVIRGIVGDEKKENCKEKTTKFLKDDMSIEVEDGDILVAHRKGTKKDDYDRPMLVQCRYELKERIFSNLKNLKDKTNANGDKFSISKQLPESVVEQNRVIREVIKEQKEKDKSLPPAQRSSIEVKNKEVFIDGYQVEKFLLAPQPVEIFVDKMEREKRDKIKFAVSDTSSLNGTELLYFAFKTGQLNEVKRTYRKIRSMHPSADHVIAAYSLKTKSGYQDDDEHGTSSRLLKTMQANKSVNTAVFVVRYKNGNNLGPTRFEMIEQSAMQAINRLK